MGAGPLPSSSGGPAAGASRTEGAGNSCTSGALGDVVPSGRGAPGAFGSALGSNASDRLGLAGTPGWPGAKGASATSGSGRGASRAIAEAEFDVLAEFLQLLLEPMLGVLELLDPAIGLAKRFLELVDAHHELGGFVWIFRAAAGNVSRRS